MIDLWSSTSLFGLLALLALSYGVRLALRGRARHARVDQEGGGPLVGRRSMEMAYWALEPIGRACAKLSVTASQVSWASLVLGLAAGVAVGMGHFGLGALVATASFMGDAVDGMVARLAGTSSDRGELIDATVDRYVEMFIFGGLALSVRGSMLALVLVLAAMTGSVMVSFATAKAEALRVRGPRGIMRRTERATILTLGLALCPLTARLGAGLSEAPILLALATIGVLANVSAVLRIFAIARAIRAPEAARGESSAPAPSTAG
jgi:CDP-diacylglycerol---glycerol-3-phosphate 3-phosphatidyltransferase